MTVHHYDNEQEVTTRARGAAGADLTYQPGELHLSGWCLRVRPVLLGLVLSATLIGGVALLCQRPTSVLAALFALLVALAGSVLTALDASERRLERLEEALRTLQADRRTPSDFTVNKRRRARPAVHQPSTDGD